MKWIFLAVLVVALVIPSQAITCRTNQDKCFQSSECCVEFGIFGACRSLLKEGDDCELRPMKSGLHKHVYLMKCPCRDGLTCVEDDSGSSIQGKCLPAKK